jgi:hypothetical protein
MARHLTLTLPLTLILTLTADPETMGLSAPLRRPVCLVKRIDSTIQPPCLIRVVCSQA